MYDFIYIYTYIKEFIYDYIFVIIDMILNMIIYIYEYTYVYIFIYYDYVCVCNKWTYMWFGSQKRYKHHFLKISLMITGLPLSPIPKKTTSTKQPLAAKYTENTHLFNSKLFFKKMVHLHPY